MVPWYHTQWCVMCQLFLLPPLGFINLICSRAFSIQAKLASLAVLIAFFFLVDRYKKSYDDHLNGLWFIEFKQLKRDFDLRRPADFCIGEISLVTEKLSKKAY